MRSRSLLYAKQKNLHLQPHIKQFVLELFFKIHKSISLLNSLGNGRIRRRFSKMPSYRSLGKGKTVPSFSKITVREQKEKAAIAACQSRFDGGYFQIDKYLVILSSPKRLNTFAIQIQGEL